ncbi:alpha/beta hydrolase [Nocardiopsis alba]|uniref:alpha/beta hydrolase n=1 Tax=Nocardiopsis alba TaxID=53437 RepID=UPI003628B5FF
MRSVVRVRVTKTGAFGLGALAVVVVATSITAHADVGGDHPFHGQSIAWEPCLTPEELAATETVEGDPDWLRRLECGTVTVPMDHGDPEGRTLDLALVRHPAQGPADGRRGSLVFEFGGPGVSGVDTFLAGSLPLGREIRDSFDLVSFDPRGVGDSEGFSCPLLRVMDRPLSEADRIGAAEVEGDLLTDMEKSAHALAAACEKEAGADFLATMGTVNVARDLDIMRDALGDERLNYVGFSYGTYIGALYAEMYPENTRALVLDGAVQTERDVVSEAVEQTGGLQTSWEAFVAFCLDRAEPCPFTGTDSALREMEGILDGIDAEPLHVADRTLDRDGFLDLLRGALYTETLWYDTAGLLARLAEGERDDFVHDYLLGLLRRGGDETPGMEESAHLAVRCADHAAPTDVRDYQEGAIRATRLSPLFGGDEVWRKLPCAYWPDTEIAPIGVTAPMAPPILVVGTLGDPATPYTWAREMADRLATATLLTYEGGGHTAYAKGHPCVNEAVDAYLLRGELPEEGTVCPTGS